MFVPSREEVGAGNTKRPVQVVQAFHAVFVQVPLGTASPVSKEQYKTENPIFLLLFTVTGRLLPPDARPVSF